MKLIYWILKIKSKIYTLITDKPDLKELKRKGLIIGENLNVQNGVNIDISHCWLIEIGNNVTLAPRVQILAHDASTKNFIDYTKIGNVIIGNNVFVGAGTVILPNVEIGDNVIIGANSVVTKDLESGYVYAGNPATKINSIEKYISKYNDFSNMITFDEKYTEIGGITTKMKEKMKQSIQGKIGLVK